MLKHYSQQQRAFPAIIKGISRTLGLGETDNSLWVLTNGTQQFLDGIQGTYSESLAKSSGDFIVRRRDGIFAYQLAVVVDNAEENISEVVRDADLLNNTQRQLFLQQLLGYRTPRYYHLPLALDSSDRKLSKQTLANPLNDNIPLPGLLTTWTFLGQSPFTRSVHSPQEFWPVAIANWSIDSVPKVSTRAAPLH